MHSVAGVPRDHQIIADLGIAAGLETQYSLTAGQRHPP